MEALLGRVVVVIVLRVRVVGVPTTTHNNNNKVHCLRERSSRLPRHQRSLDAGAAGQGGAGCRQPLPTLPGSDRLGVAQAVGMHLTSGGRVASRGTRPHRPEG